MPPFGGMEVVPPQSSHVLVSLKLFLSSILSATWGAAKRHFQCAEQQESPSHFTKYCACHAKWISCLIRITYETSFPMRGATGINLQPHQILRLPRKIALPNLREINWKQLKWHFQCATDPTMIRPRSEHDPRMIRPRKRKPQPAAPQRLLFALARSRFYWQLQRFPAPAIIPNFTTCCACHEKWHMNFTKCCACQEKWHMNFTKCCACHEKWHEVTHDYYYYYYYH